MMNSILFINGKIWDKNGSFNSAFGITGDKIDFVGDNDFANKIKSRYSKIIDLKGKTVLPGLIDSHMHLVYGSLMRKRIDCRNIKTPDELSKIINEHITKNKKQTEWVIGSNLDINALNINFENGNPLNLISQNIPIYLINYDYHSALANTPVIKESGLFDKFSKFSSEEVPKLKDGFPSGLLKERAMKYIFNHMPEPSFELKVEAVKDFIKVLHSFGITGVCDILLTEDIEVYPKLQNSGNAKIRINSYLPIQEFKNIEKYIKITKALDKEFFKSSSIS